MGLLSQFLQVTDNQEHFPIEDECETSFAFLNDPIDSIKAVKNEKTLVSQIPSNIGEKVIVLAPG